MANKTNILTMLKLFAQKQNSALVYFAEFCDYMNRYAQRHLDADADLTPFLSDPETALNAAVAQLVERHSVMLVNAEKDKKAIIVIPFYTERFASRYREILSNPTVPYPLITDLPKHIPVDIVDKQPAATLLEDLFEHQQDSSDQTDFNYGSSASPVSAALYGLVLPRELPIILYPSNIPANILLDIALTKIREMLRKEEYHDYFLKKLKISNPGKDLSVKSFFSQLIQRPAEALEAIHTSGESFYFWNQLCFFIRQDYDKVKDYTQEDTALLQSICITEIALSYYRNKAQQNIQRDAALRILEQHFERPPYYFNKETIQSFTDSKGASLLGQYTEKDLNEFLHTKTTVLLDNNLPELLTIRLHTGQHYYVNKGKVIPLIVRLCGDARETVKSNLTAEWFNLYKKFENVPAMSDQKAFERRLEQELVTTAPVLYALLNSNFLSLIHYEMLTARDGPKTMFTLFADGKLLPYSELLMLSRREIVADAKILLPFWYTVPPISWIARLILRPKKKKEEKKSVSVPEQARFQMEEGEDEATKNLPRNVRKKEFRSAAQEAENELIPPGSNLERELASYINQWNKLITKPLRENLIEDVNSLIRDYMRKTIRTLKSKNFTVDRMYDLADTLIKTTALQKIKDKEALQMYIVLYIVKLVKES